MVAIKDVSWIHFEEDGVAVCDRCGGRHNINAILPLPLDCVEDLARLIQKAHRYCKEVENAGAQKDNRV